MVYCSIQIPTFWGDFGTCADSNPQDFLAWFEASITHTLLTSLYDFVVLALKYSYREVVFVSLLTQGCISTTKHGWFSMG